jgi:hypothetical protein
MTSIQERKKCNKCKVNLLFKEFKPKRNGTLTKRCIQCLDYNNKWQHKNKGKYKCEHNKQKSSCKECGGSQICEHNKQKSQCKECGGSRICEHNKQKSSCKECGGSQICEHDRIKSQCKECGGSSICEHNRQKSICKECGGGSICEHDRIKSQCKECGGGRICEHNRQKSTCKECGGSSICVHNRQKPQCKECGGSSICEHNRQKSICKDCGGSQICEHNKRKSTCKICDPQGHLASIVRGSVRRALQSDKSKHSIEYLGCSIQHFKEHIEKQFVEGMNWDNYGEWHIDHIIPLKYENPTMEETIERLHWENTQPLWATDNIAKSNRYIG